nr:hypothetical protein MACL_00001876 [Theileria orientalis]
MLTKILIKVLIYVLFYWQKFAYSAPVTGSSSQSGTAIDLDITVATHNDYNYNKDVNMLTFTPKAGKTFKSVKDGATDVWKAADANSYASKVEVDVVTADNKAVTVQMAGNQTKVFRKHGKNQPWKEIDITKTNPQSVNIKYKYNSYFYTNTVSNNVRTFQAKTGFAFNSVNEYINNQKTEIWKTEQENEFARKVEVEENKVTIYTGEGTSPKTKVFSKGSDQKWNEDTSGGSQAGQAGLGAAPGPRPRSDASSGGPSPRTGAPTSITVKIPDDDDKSSQQSGTGPVAGAPAMPKARSAPTPGGTPARTATSVALPEDDDDKSTQQPSAGQVTGTAVQPGAPSMPRARSAPTSGAPLTRMSTSIALPEDDEGKSQAAPAQSPGTTAQPASTSGPRPRTAPVAGGTASRTATSVPLGDDDEDKSKTQARPPLGSGTATVATQPGSALEAAMSFSIPASTATPAALAPKPAATPVATSVPIPAGTAPGTPVAIAKPRRAAPTQLSISLTSPGASTGTPDASPPSVPVSTGAPLTAQKQAVPAGAPVTRSSRSPMVISIPATPSQTPATPVASSVPAAKPAEQAGAPTVIPFGLNPFDIKFNSFPMWSDQFGKEEEAVPTERKLMLYMDQTWKAALCDDITNYKKFLDDLKSQQKTRSPSHVT